METEDLLFPFSLFHSIQKRISDSFRDAGDRMMRDGVACEAVPWHPRTLPRALHPLQRPHGRHSHTPVLARPASSLPAQPLCLGCSFAPYLQPQHILAV